MTGFSFTYNSVDFATMFVGVEEECSHDELSNGKVFSGQVPGSGTAIYIGGRGEMRVRLSCYAQADGVTYTSIPALTDAVAAALDYFTWQTLTVDQWPGRTFQAIPESAVEAVWISSMVTRFTIDFLAREVPA